MVICIVEDVYLNLHVLPPTIDGVFNFLDTYEERALKLKVLDHEASEERDKLEKSLQEVRHKLPHLHVYIAPQCVMSLFFLFPFFSKQHI